MEIQEVIKNHRMENNLKQAYISSKSDMSQSNYSQIETGKVKPSLDKLKKIAGVYGKTATQFIEEMREIKIEHNNHPNSNNNSKNGFFMANKTLTTSSIPQDGL